MFDWVVAIVISGGVLGVAFLMFAENVFPPIPSEVIMPLAGFAAAQGHMSFPAVVAAGSTGALAGAVLWKLVGRQVPQRRLGTWIDRHGRWLTLERRDLARARLLFRTHGGTTVFFGRLLPGIRTFISVPAGLVRMRWGSFILWTTLGTLLWTLALAAAGYLLAAEYHRVEQWLDPITTAILVGVVAIYLWRVLRWNGTSGPRAA